MDFNFESEVDQELFDKTKSAWNQQVEADPENISSTYYEAGLDYLQKILSQDGGTAELPNRICAVIEDGEETASALIVVTHAGNHTDRPYLKMLNVYVQPKLNVADKTPNIPELAWIAATAIIGCLGLTYSDYPSQELKIHTGVPLDKEFLSAVTTAMLGNRMFDANYSVNGHGPWIVVAKKHENNVESAC